MNVLRFNDIVEVAGRKIGLGQPCFIVAEAGINHNGDVGLAKLLIDAAAEAGADAVKFQNYSTEDFLSNRDLTFTYVSQGHQITEAQYDAFKRCELSPDELAELKSHCDARGIVFQSTPSSPRGIKDLMAIGAPFLKSSSDCLTHLELIRAMGETGLPTAISTGMATGAEIEKAVEAFHETGNRNLVLLHCVSSYPTPENETNLARIPRLARAFDCPIGFSDHTLGTLAAALSVALGACLIEKHCTLDHDLPGPDHWFSLSPGELAELVKAARSAQKMVGTSDLSPTKSEEQGRLDFRLSCVAATDLPKGHRLTVQDIAFRRPGHGMPPNEVSLLDGRILRRAVPNGHVFVVEDMMCHLPAR